ncbi:MAG: DEAD/DEAH box helicase [Acidobacteriota bacterium]
MNVFELRDRLIEDYSSYIESFIQIRDERIRDYVGEQLREGLLWPDPIIQLNPSFEPGKTINEMVDEGVLHPECGRIFRAAKEKEPTGKRLRLHRHQEEAIRAARSDHNYVLTTGTGSGKSLAYIVPIVDQVLRAGSGKGIKAIVVYPMNALANSQLGELDKFVNLGFPDQKGPVTFRRYTGQENEEQKDEIRANPPDIILTNYVMLELILTRPRDQALVRAAHHLQFLVLDELHTYRGRQGADVALLVRRAREATSGSRLRCVGTSATLAGAGTFQEQQQQVAEIATRIFGAEVRPEQVIGETLQRATGERSFDDPAFIEVLRVRLSQELDNPPAQYQAFIQDPLSSWIESTFGVTRDPTGRLVRSPPGTLLGEDGAARSLSDLTGVPLERAARQIEKALLASYHCLPDPETGFQPFAFRLHQFISRGDTAYASLQPEDQRYITAYRQLFVPGDRSKVLLPLAFCRECGQEYYCVRKFSLESSHNAYQPRELSDRERDERSEAGFLYLSTEAPWPVDYRQVLERIPDDWRHEVQGRVTILSSRQKSLPRTRYLTPAGEDTPRESEEAVQCAYITAPFRFCLRCGASYNFRQRTDFGKLAPLGSEGRSTATTLLSLSTVRTLRSGDMELPPRARKLLSFTDNRQDASLQAGHFNDFVEIGVLRSALCRAAHDAGERGLSYDELTQKVFAALDLPLHYYASDPEVRFQARLETERAFRSVLGYRLYRDLRRGWRVTSPNLEQCGLLEIQYPSLRELAEAGDVWENFHPTLGVARPETRVAICRVLLDFMRRELAIDVDYLEADFQERLRQQSSQRLIPPWGIDENESLEHARLLIPRSRRPGDHGGWTYLSPRGGFGQYLRRSTTFADYVEPIRLEETGTIILQLLEALKTAGLVREVLKAEGSDEAGGYQLPASAMVWRVGEGTRPFHDVIRMPNLPQEGGRTNPFFIDFYRNVAGQLSGIEAREHTAQVPYEERGKREEAFREARLPVLFCSPTMELGVDIAQLNVVNLRNVPPTPANYAQRSGRAGRSGQPALVFSYCSGGSPHDQYFFKRPERMVMGAVTPPRLDVGNEDLVAAHVQAIWLAETGLYLGSSLAEILDLSGESPTLDLLSHVQDGIEAETPKRRALERARSILATIGDELERSEWYSSDWLDGVIASVARNFERTCDRWRNLYRAANAQRMTQNSIIGDASRSPQDKQRAKRLRAQAESQLELLAQGENIIQSDFYSYRYFASEGFLPGYSFPRLPLSAYIPGRRRAKGQDEFISRPRFLAISEFGPRAFLYHEGSRYLINRVILAVDEEERDLTTSRAKQCEKCGYLHPVLNGDGPDLCESCGAALGVAFTRLFRLQNVSTRRRDRINSDEEERLRLGYEIRTGIRFAEPHGRPARRMAEILHPDGPLADLTYGHAATLWRINLGWMRRRDRQQYGFILDTENGYWHRNTQAVEDDRDDPYSQSQLRVIPFVEDRKNCILFKPRMNLSEIQMASLQSALKNAIQVVYQLEDNELVAEPLPNRDHRNLILFFESAEGGAGVLRHLLDDPRALATVASRALEICHFDPETGEDLKRAPRAHEDCEAACYDCLMSYVNQMDHRLLDRQTVRGVLLDLMRARVEASPVELSRPEHLRRLLHLCDSELEKKFLHYLEERQYRLPSAAQRLLEGFGTRPDFLYQDSLALIYVDGPPHDYPERKQRDQQQTDRLEDAGYTVIRFGHHDAWDKIIAKYPSLFGSGSS